MRDHLLGCAQFIPDVENEPTHFVTLRRRYPLGTPSRVHRDLESHVVKSMEDGQQISGSFHRHVVAPGDDYSSEDPRVQAICAATHTPEVIAAYQASLQPPA